MPERKDPFEVPDYIKKLPPDFIQKELEKMRRKKPFEERRPVIEEEPQKDWDDRDKEEEN